MAAPFDLSALQQALNDPSIKEMAEKIANDPAFQGLTSQLQDSMSSMMSGGVPAAGAAPDMAGFDPSRYMQAISGMFQNQQFMAMAEKLGQAIIQTDPNMMQMMQTVQNPEYKSKVEEAMGKLKDDPEMGPIIEELQSGGPAAMMKYWNDPAILKKLGTAMGDVIDFEAMLGGLGGPAANGQEEAEEEAEDDDEEAPNLHTAASDGNVDLLREMLDAGADVDEVDEEGRTALHFAAGYGEIECAKMLIEKKAKLDLVDGNNNTALHYAAGYGQAESVKLLLESGADKEAKNADGKTALEVAQLNDQEPVAALLQ